MIDLATWKRLSLLQKGKILFADATFMEYVHYFWTLLWGTWMLNPFLDTFENIQGGIYCKLEALVPNEIFWGLIAVVIAAIGLYGFRYWKRRYRQVSMLLMIFFWAFMLNMVFMAKPASMLVPFYAWLTFSSIFMYSRRI